MLSLKRFAVLSHLKSASILTLPIVGFTRPDNCSNVIDLVEACEASIGFSGACFSQMRSRDDPLCLATSPLRRVLGSDVNSICPAPRSSKNASPPHHVFEVFNRH